MVRLLAYLLDLVVIVLFGRLLGKAFERMFGSSEVHARSASSGHDGGDSSRSAASQTERDPICGMFVSTELSHRLTQGEKTLHFCSEECLERYQKDASHRQN